MNMKPQMSDTPAVKQAEIAISHTLRNISERPGVAWYLGHGTQTYALLVEALSTITNKMMAEIQSIFPPADQPNFEGDTLNQCPFCGSHALSGGESDDLEIHFMTCLDCRATGPRIDEFDYDSKEEAIEASARKWNERQMPR